MLSKNFSLAEMLASQTAAQQGFTEQFTPPPHIVANLQLLCVNVLQPLRDFVGHPLKVNSGYRCPRLNTFLGGAPNSQHVKGQAVDITDLHSGNQYLLRAFLRLNLPFDQLIDEFNLSWLHISYNHIRPNRFEQLKAIKDTGGRTKYLKVL